MIRQPRVPSTSTSTAPPAAAAAPAPKKEEKKKAPVKKEESDDDDDDFKMSLDDDDDEDDGGAAAAIIAKKNAERASIKNQNKPGEQAKSSVVIDVKPEDSETDMVELERLVRTIVLDGLLWGAAELVPVAYGIKKLRIMAVVVDDLVGVDDLQESLEELEGVQSTDIMSFQKI
jgi:translation elongation factor EF-1beta